MKYLYYTFMLVSIMGGMLVSCAQQEEDQFRPSSGLSQQSFPSFELAPDQTLTKKEISALQLAGFAGQIVEVLLSQENETSPVKREYLIGGDMVLSEENLRERAEFASNASPESKQYRFGVTVGSQYPTIRVHGVNMGRHPEMADALRYAVARYNDLNIRHNLVLSFVTTGLLPSQFVRNSNLISVVPVSSLSIEGAAAIADLPSMYGNPGAVIRVLNNTSNRSTNFLRYLMMHEIGHTLGMAHTDWFDPNTHSCSRGNSTLPGMDPIPEVTPGARGPVHIPGTPANPDSDGVTIFKVCHPGPFAQDVFSHYDVIALETTFPVNSSEVTPTGCLCLITERCLNGECVPR